MSNTCQKMGHRSRVTGKIGTGRVMLRSRWPAPAGSTGKEARVIQAIDRAAKVLAALQGSRLLGISELGVLLDLPPSTVHGIVKSLQTHGLVTKEPHGQRYMLGPTLL